MHAQYKRAANAARFHLQAPYIHFNNRPLQCVADMVEREENMGRLQNIESCTLLFLFSNTSKRHCVPALK